ncbi:MAG: hypothetical protein Q9182_006259 [Xanthomendoza sp. 2 TL-2023]
MVPGKISDGSLEFSRFVQLLGLTGKLPLVSHFRVLGDVEDLGGVSPTVFNNTMSTTIASACTKFPDFSTNLKHLNLSLACLFEAGQRPLGMNLNILKHFFQAAQSLESVSLVLLLKCFPGPFSWDFTQVFPLVTQWSLPNLRLLRLRGLRISYKNLAGLLFINLPKLDTLHLSEFQLNDGRWEDIIEGLRHLANLRSCELSDVGLLYPYDSFYERWMEEVYGWDNLEKPEESAFLAAIHEYISQGGRHPYLPKDAPEKASCEYMHRLRKTLDELRRVHILTR